MWAAALLAVYAAVVVLATVLQRSLIYFPSAERPELSRAGPPGAREVAYTTADGVALYAWYRPAEEGRPTIVLLHGNAGHIGHRVSKAAPLVAAGYGVLLVEYRGYGGNPGRPTEEGLVADSRAALDWLGGEGVPPERTVLYGESLGTGLAVRLATEYPVAGVVLEAPYTAVVDVARSRFWFLPVNWLMQDRFESLTRLGDVAAPILVLHGTADGVIPVAHGRRMAAAAGATFHEIPAAGHMDLYDFGADRLILDWLDGLG
ncbi:MAG: alpha/beta fold hydrolase [Rhodospirillaceae bacterium]|nr:alpha/beta fold hydrolase [Rhodospirillaceae bacterium]